MAKSELWDSVVIGWLLDRFWAFPVKRGESDRAALTRAGAYLKSGEPVGVFPEGTRNRDGEAEAQGGAAFLALRNGVPVVPVGIAGTERISPAGTHGIHFPKVVISFGAPIDPALIPAGGKKERVEMMTAEIMRRISEQLELAREVAGS
jgi:1-acyl-sn-glycerol-3-phosphate acyltransferase